MSLHRRRFIASVTLAAVSMSSRAAAPKATVEVWTGPSCSCCKDWVMHLEANGFQAVVHDGGNSDARARLGMPLKYGACHSAVVGGYAIEGHVPAREIHRLMKERPAAVGLAVPAMPRGSPGMDAPAYGQQRDPYDVLLVLRDGSVRVYQSYV